MNQEGAKLHRRKWLCAFIIQEKCLFILKKKGL
ncbi:unknown [Prevotella sp. CAG:732]|nr:unknown [Prevotella sp. CAG:732]